MELQSVGVVGAGTIGSGVAQSLAQSGHQVVLVDRSPEQLAAAQAGIRKNLRTFGLIQKQSAGGPVEETLERIRWTTDIGSLAAVSFTVENVTEDWEIKREVHGQLDRLCAPDAPVAVNTSAIPITRLGSLYRDPSRVVGMHFMNPVPLMPMVEVIRGVHTSEDTLRKTKRLVAQMGKECIAVNDSPGFVTNRVMMLMVNEAAFLLHEGVASVEEIDRLFKTCFGHKMGPLETADLIGLDTVLYSLAVLYDEFNDDKFRPCPLLKRRVYAGHNGRKSGRGFYDYAIRSPGDGAERRS